MLRPVALTVLAAIGLGCGTSIHDEVAAGNIDEVRAMLDRSPELANATDRLGKTPLFFAVTYGRKDMIDLFVERGADVNAADKTGLTPLHVAAMLGRGYEADKLVELGADVAWCDAFGDTPLHTAAMHGATPMIEYLLSRNADIEATNNERLTPYELAVKHRQNAAASQLKAFGAKS